MATTGKDSFGRAGYELRQILQALADDVAAVYRERGLADYRGHFSPVIRTLAATGPQSIRNLATSTAVTHSAASQTVAQLLRADLVTVGTGADARQRIVHLSHRARSMLPLVAAEWDATEAAAAELEAALPCPLADIVAALRAALVQRPFRARIADAGLPQPGSAAGP